MLEKRPYEMTKQIRNSQINNLYDRMKQESFNYKKTRTFSEIKGEEYNDSKTYKDEVKELPIGYRKKKKSFS